MNGLLDRASSLKAVDQPMAYFSSITHHGAAARPAHRLIPLVPSLLFRPLAALPRSDRPASPSWPKRPSATGQPARICLDARREEHGVEVAQNKLKLVSGRSFRYRERVQESKCAQWRHSFFLFLSTEPWIVNVKAALRTKPGLSRETFHNPPNMRSPATESHSVYCSVRDGGPAVRKAKGGRRGESRKSASWPLPMQDSGNMEVAWDAACLFRCPPVLRSSIRGTSSGKLKKTEIMSLAPCITLSLLLYMMPHDHLLRARAVRQPV